MGKKLFVLDTNVILHDFNCLHSFQDNDIAIPMTVLEEIDRFKTGHAQVNYNARHFSRVLDGLSGDKLVEGGGVRLANNEGHLRIVVGHFHELEKEKIFTEDTPDHRILSVAYYLNKTLNDRTVVLVSKDVNVRLKAKSIGLISQDYFTDKIRDIDKLYTGKQYINDFPEELIDALCRPKGRMARNNAGLTDISPNEYFIFKNNKKSVPAVYDPVEDAFFRVEKKEAFKILPRNAEQLFALHALMNPNIQLVTLSGKAGTGKTLLALAAALETHAKYQQIYLARPIVPLSNKDLGFLPGDVQAKLDPFMQPLYDNLSVIKNQYQKKDPNYKIIAQMQKDEELVIAPLAYIRGRSLEKIYFIVDEAQNLTPHEVKTIITRAAAGTKVIFTGDPHQIDTPYLDAQSNGLTYLIDRMKGQNLYAHITLEKGERSVLADLASDLL
jgi:PhoH-like ATPase